MLHLSHLGLPSRLRLLLAPRLRRPHQLIHRSDPPRPAALAGVVLIAVVMAPPWSQTAGAAEAAIVASSSTATATVGTSYLAPVPEPLRVARAFQAPTSPYGPGHRGVDLDVAAAQLVRSPAAGVVAFAGQVAGRGVVVIDHPDGIHTEYEPVRALIRVGVGVAQGDPVAQLVGTDAGCGRAHCLHWGARRGSVYLDPLDLLHPLGPVRLLPW